MLNATPVTRIYIAAGEILSWLPHSWHNFCSSVLAVQLGARLNKTVLNSMDSWFSRMHFLSVHIQIPYPLYCSSMASLMHRRGANLKIWPYLSHNAMRLLHPQLRLRIQRSWLNVICFSTASSSHIRYTDKGKPFPFPAHVSVTRCVDYVHKGACFSHCVAILKE